MRLIGLGWINAGLMVAMVVVLGCGETRSRDSNAPRIGASSFESAGSAGTTRGGGEADAGVAAPGEDSDGARSPSRERTTRAPPIRSKQACRV